MQDYLPLLNHIASQIELSEEEKNLFISVLQTNRVKRKQFIEQPGYVSKHRTFVVQGALRAFFIGIDGQEHTISLAVDNGMIGDPGSFLSQEPATLYVEAIEDSLLIQWSSENEQMLLKQILQFATVMMRRAQQIAMAMQRRLRSYCKIGEHIVNRQQKVDICD